MDAYKLLSDMYDKCVEAMKAGEPLKAVYETAKTFLQRKNEDYVQYLPKNLGSAIGKCQIYQNRHLVNFVIMSVLAAI